MKIRDAIGPLNPERIRNIRIVVLCILAAATFWFLNALNDSYSATLRYPVDFIYDEENYVPTTALPEVIQLNVSGVGWNLFRNNLGLNDAPIQLVLERPAETKKLPASTLLGTISEQLAEFQVNFILTDTLFINVDRRIERTFPLRVDSANIELENSFWIVDRINFDPLSVKLEGPESIINSMKDTLLVTIPEDNIDDNYNEDIPIQIENSQLINRDPPTINIKFTVEEYIDASTFQMIETINFPEDSSAYLNINKSKIDYQIAKSKAENLNDSSFQVIANFLKLNKEDSTLAQELIKYPEDIRNARLDSSLLKVFFNEK